MTEQVVSKVYSKAFDEFVNDEKEQTADFANEIRQKQAFFELCKQVKPHTEEKSKLNPLFIYRQECQKLDVHPLPIFSKIDGKSLSLRGYVLNEGVCKAFLKAAQMSQDLLETVHFEENQLIDKNLGLLMEGVNHF